MKKGVRLQYAVEVRVMEGKEIKTGDMFSVNYGYVADSKAEEGIPCYCLASNCTGKLFTLRPTPNRTVHNRIYELLGDKLPGI